MSTLQAQRATCARFGVEHFATPPSSMVSIAQGALDGGRPLNALRHPPEGDTSGWWRVLIADGYEDVWFDSALLDVSTG